MWADAAPRRDSNLVRPHRAWVWVTDDPPGPFRRNRHRRRRPTCSTRQFSRVTGSAPASGWRTRLDGPFAGVLAGRSEFDPDAGPLEPLDRLAIQRLGRFPLGQQRPGASLDAERPVGPACPRGL